VRDFLSRLDQQFPYWFYFVDPQCGFLQVLLGCQSPLRDVSYSADHTRARSGISGVDIALFLERHFAPLNAILDHFHLDDANDTLNKQIVGQILKSLNITMQINTN
jgi:hypothetical protein